MKDVEMYIKIFNDNALDQAFLFIRTLYRLWQRDRDNEGNYEIGSR